MSLGGSSKASKNSTKESGTEEKSGATTGSSQLVLEQDAIDRIIENVLSGPGGLAEIFQGEQTAGVFDSSVAAQASGNLVANIVGEIAKITGETVTSGTTESLLDFTKRKSTKSAEVSVSGSFGK